MKHKAALHYSKVLNIFHIKSHKYLASLEHEM